MVSPRTSRGFGKLANLLVANDILAHLRATAFKVFGAILLATRTKTGSCWPGVKTLARWSGIAENRISMETEYLEAHGLIRKKRMRMGNNKQRIIYHVVYPSDPEYPDFRNGCSICDEGAHRRTRVVRDPVTGRLQGTRPRPESPDHRSPESPEDRSPHMTPDDRNSNQTESDEKTSSRRGGGVGKPATSSSRAPRGGGIPANGNTGLSPWERRPKTPAEAATDQQTKQLAALRKLAQNPTMTTEAKLELAKKGRYSQAMVTEVFGESTTGMAGSTVPASPTDSPMPSDALAESGSAEGGVA